MSVFETCRACLVTMPLLSISWDISRHRIKFKKQSLQPNKEAEMVGTIVVLSNQRIANMSLDHSSETTGFEQGKKERKKERINFSGHSLHKFGNSSL